VVPVRGQAACALAPVEGAGEVDGCGIEGRGAVRVVAEVAVDELAADAIARSLVVK